MSDVTSSAESRLHDESCCMVGVGPDKGPHRDCPGKDAMTTDQTEALSFVKRCAAAADKFTEDMRAQDIHVGLGARDPRCVTCGERWPCATSETRRG